jgi:hypothetical protein
MYLFAQSQPVSRDTQNRLKAFLIREPVFIVNNPLIIIRNRNELVFYVNELIRRQQAHEIISCIFLSYFIERARSQREQISLKEKKEL